ncbi:FadR/GntR family transcriptional regulator [Leeia oryzae]|uniref:FadR/GntR family transcriptional regulator n=1 Tax=Leeia oryzae TaxID=356662 RepID=UPI000376E706|nr:FadR/GntR family transcriptional regulator [Leeia oryzae]
MPLQAVESKRIYQKIAEQIRALIESGEFAAGTALPPERTLAQEMGVSRASVREAIIALEVSGLVEVRVGSGIYVCNSAPSTPDAHQWEFDPELGLNLEMNEELSPFSILKARLLIEPEAAALAAEHADAEQRQLIRDAYAQNVQDNQAASTTHPGDRLFHIRIAEASGNEAFAFFIKHMLAHRYGVLFKRLQTLYTPNDMPLRSQMEHEAILNAIDARDPQQARQAMHKHITSVIDIFLRGQ